MEWQEEDKIPKMGMDRMATAKYSAGELQKILTAENSPGFF